MRGWWLARRNALLASGRFQRLALRLPLIRHVAQSHARRLFDVVAGFTYSQILFACVELDLLRQVRTPRDMVDLAAATGMAEAALDRLVGAARPLGLLDRFTDGRVTLGPAGAALLADPGIAAMIRHHRLLYADLADPVALLREPGSGALSRFWSYAGDADPVAVATYSELMAASSQPVADQLLAAHDFSRYRRLLDIGGGEGHFLAALRLRNPGVALGLLDLPTVIARAEARLGPTVTYHPGDFRYLPVPPGYDCITLVRVLHDHDDRIAAALLRKIHAALSKGGQLVISEPMAGVRGAERVGSTYFAAYFLAMGRGRARTPGEIGAMARAAGFARWRQVATPLPLRSSIVVATV